MQSNSATETSKQLRKQFRALRNSLNSGEQASAARGALTQCLKLESFNTAKHIALYLANDGELITQAIVDYCWKQGKSVYLPVLHPFVKNTLAFFEYSEETQMRSNRFGIDEPKLDVRKIIPVKALDIIFTPLVAFDKEGNRLGMGGGFYDRTLSKLTRTSTAQTNATQTNKTQLVGLAHDCQQAEKLPAQTWDIPLSTIVTPSRVIKAKY